MEQKNLNNVSACFDDTRTTDKVLATQGTMPQRTTAGIIERITGNEIASFTGCEERRINRVCGFTLTMHIE